MYTGSDGSTMYEEIEWMKTTDRR